MNQTKRKLKSAYSSTRKTILNLVGKNILSEAGFQTVEHTGLRTQTYDLTLEGVIFVLKQEFSGKWEKWNHSLIEKIIRKYERLLPLVFGKWSRFHERGVERMALLRLKVIVDTQRSDRNSFRKGVGWYRWLEMPEQITRFFYFWRIYPTSFVTWPSEKDQKNWVKMWKQDKNIRSYVVEAIEEELRGFRKAIISGENILSFLQRD